MFFKNEYKFLSNFAKCDIILYNLHFNSVESAYQSSKTSNLQIIETFCNLNPLEAKRAGKKIKPLRQNWEQIKISIMYFLLRQKFRNQYFKKLLINTGDIHIQEDNYWNDTFWGVCNHKGYNILGVLLMIIRTEINQNLL